jgi:hypothetical protein
MERVSLVVESRPGLSGRAVADLAKGKAAHKRTALELLIAEEFVTVKREGNALKHFSQRPYREGDSDGVSAGQT